MSKVNLEIPFLSKDEEGFEWVTVIKYSDEGITLEFQRGEEYRWRLIKNWDIKFFEEAGINLSKEDRMKIATLMWEDERYSVFKRRQKFFEKCKSKGIHGKSVDRLLYIRDNLKYPDKKEYIERIISCNHK